MRRNLVKRLKQWGFVFLLLFAGIGLVQVHATNLYVTCTNADPPNVIGTYLPISDADGYTRWYNSTNGFYIRAQYTNPPGEAFRYIDTNGSGNPSAPYWSKLFPVASGNYNPIVSVTGILVVSDSPPLPLKATSPVPGDGAINQSAGITLSWADGGGASGYQVFFGVSNSMTDHGAVSITSYVVTGLLRTNNYQWRIDATNLYGTATGDVWSFTVTNYPLVLILGGVWPSVGGTGVGNSRGYIQ